MNFRFTVVEMALNRAEFRWKGLKFLESTLLLATLFGLLLFAFAGAILVGWLQSRTIALALLVAIGASGFIAWLVLTVRVFSRAPDRHWLAAALERVDNRLLDRLNTLLFLEGKRGERNTESFALRIARQTQGVIAEKTPESPFSGRRVLTYTASLFSVLLGIGFIQWKYSPWERLQSTASLKPNKAVELNEPNLNLEGPAANNVEQNLPWGEVRITDPGEDMKLTKVDVLPLQIEAAASQPLNQVDWFSTVNGAAETRHELGPPTEPRYAVYQPLVYLDELNLSDWDVMTYYARANTDQSERYASQIYFLEVRPFREDLLKLPGGENGPAYRCLNELSGLIREQQHIIRETHQHVQKPPEQPNLREQDRTKLAEAETDLVISVQHLYAKMVSKMENKGIGEALDNLAKAEGSLDKARKGLKENALEIAQNRERDALSELVAARKMFQKAVSDNPGQFGDAEEPEPKTEDAAAALKQIAEFRDEARATREFVKKLVEQERRMEQEVQSAQRANYPRLAQQEAELQKSLSDFQAQHPQPFKECQNESQSADQSLGKAGESLRSHSSQARQSMREATENLEKLAQAVNQHSADKDLAGAYHLKQMLDQQIQTYGECANGSPGVGQGELRQTIEQSRETLKQLKTLAEQEPTRDAFGQPLRNSLSGENKVDLESKLNRLQQAQDETSRKDGAGAAKDALAKVSKAFDESAPKALQLAQKGDSLKPGESLGSGMASLESLLKQLEQGRQVPPEDLAKQARDALFSLQSGMRSQYGDNERGNQLLLKMEKSLKAEGFEVDQLKRLMDELQRFSIENSEKLAKKDDKPEVTNINPAKLPPAYRGRIQKYFQKLSEK